MKPIHALAVVVLAFGLVACQKPKQVQPDTSGAATTTDAGAAGTSGLGTEDSGAAGRPLTPQQQALADLQQKSIVYFDFDSSEIRSEYVPVVAAHAASRAIRTRRAPASTTLVSASAVRRPSAGR